MNSAKLVNGITPRKLIGTLVLAFALAVGAFGTAKAAQAIFVSAGPTTIFDGVISGKTSHSLTVATNGNTAVTLEVDSHTIITDNQSLGDLNIGEPVKIVARHVDGVLLAKVVNVSSVASYGTAGDTVLVQRGAVVSKSGNANGGIIVVKINGLNVTFHINSSTRFFDSSFSGLHAGDDVQIFGQDTGSSSTGFVAQTIFGK
jgi:hypothetical protein